MPVMYVKELAELVGLTDRRIRMINKELPEDQKFIVRKDHGKADLATFVQRWAAYKERLARGSTEISWEQAKTQHELYKIEKTKMAVEQLRGELVPAALVLRAYQEVIAGVKNNLLNIPIAIAQEIADAGTADEAEEIMTNAIREALGELSRMKELRIEAKDAGPLEDPEEEEDREWEMS